MATAQKDIQEHWNKEAQKVLKGKTIIEARYLNDGTSCILSADDEGNEGGVLFYGDSGVLPTL